MENEKASVLLDLLASGAAEPEDRVEKMVEWKNDRFKERGKLIVSGALSLLGSLVAAFFKNEFTDQPKAAAFCLMATLLAGYVGFRHLNRLQYSAREYVNALILLDLVRSRPALAARLKTLLRYVRLP